MENDAHQDEVESAPLYIFDNHPQSGARYGSVSPSVVAARRSMAAKLALKKSTVADQDLAGRHWWPHNDAHGENTPFRKFARITRVMR